MDLKRADEDAKHEGPQQVEVPRSDTVRQELANEDEKEEHIFLREIRRRFEEIRIPPEVVDAFMNDANGQNSVLRFLLGTQICHKIPCPSFSQTPGIGKRCCLRTCI